MANNTVVFSQHQLNFDSIDVLIQQVSEILKVNVWYGFKSIYDCSEWLEKIKWKDLNIPAQGNSYVLKKHIVDNHWATAAILHVDYQNKWLYQRFGDDVGNLPQIKEINGDNVQLNIQHIKCGKDFPDILELITDTINLDIGKAVIDLPENFIFDKYYYLLYSVLGELCDPKELIPSLNKNQSICQLFGGKGTYYINDSSSILALGQWQEIDKTWKEIELEFNRNLKPEDIINIRKCIYDEDYRAAMHAKVESLSWRKFPALYDDYKNYIVH